MSAGMAGHETGDSASDRPIFTLLHAGVGGCIENLLVDTIGNIEIGAVRMTRYAPMTPKQLKLRRCKLPGKQVISQSESTQVTLCKYQLTRPGLDSTMAEIIKAPL
jgi:hypothetical protein